MWTIRNPDEPGSGQEDGQGPEQGYETPEDAADGLAEVLMEQLDASGNRPDDAAFRTAVCLIALELHAGNRTARADRRRADSRKRLREMYLSGQYDL